MKSLLALWLTAPVINRHHLRQSGIENLGKHILACSDSKHFAFHRLRRRVVDVGHCKAKKFRMILPCIGPVYLNGLLLSFCLCSFIFCVILMHIKLATVLRLLFYSALCKSFLCCMALI